MEKRKALIVCGIFFTLMMFTIPIALKKLPLIVKASRYIYLKRKEGYQLILYFDCQGKLREVVARFNSPSGTIGGIKSGASEREVSAKMGKPISKSCTSADDIWCFYAKKGGYIGVHFWMDNADAVMFVHDNPELPFGIRMGIGQEEVVRILGAPDAIEEAKERKGFPLLAFLIIIVVSFWGTYISFILPRFRFKFSWLLALIVNSIVYGILCFSITVFYFHVERYLDHRQFTLYPPILVEIPWWMMNFSLYGWVVFFIIGLQLGAVETTLMYAKHLRRKRFWYLFGLIVFIPLMGYLLSLALHFLSSFKPLPSSFLFRKAWVTFPHCLLTCLFVVGWHYLLSKESEGKCEELGNINV